MVSTIKIGGGFLKSFPSAAIEDMRKGAVSFLLGGGRLLMAAPLTLAYWTSRRGRHLCTSHAAAQWMPAGTWTGWRFWISSSKRNQTWTTGTMCAPLHHPPGTARCDLTGPLAIPRFHGLMKWPRHRPPAGSLGCMAFRESPDLWPWTLILPLIAWHMLFRHYAISLFLCEACESSDNLAWPLHVPPL